MATRNSTRKPTIPQEGKHIAYDRETKDYACWLDGQYIGAAVSYHEAETKIRDLYYEQLRDTAIAVADDEAEYALEYSAVGAVSLTIDSRGASLCIGNKLVSLSHGELRALRQVLNTPGAKL